jgi:hypothetical protein
MKAKLERHIVLHIGELILRGLPYGQRYRIAAAVEAELQRLLDEGGLPSSLAAGGSLPQVQVDSLQFVDGAKPAVVGAQIAASIYSNLGGIQSSSGLPDRSTV